MNFFAVLLILAAIATPAPSPSPPLRLITTVKASKLCAALRKNIYTAIGGMIANDSLVRQGGMLVQKARADAAADPESLGATGGAGASSELDDVRLGQLVNALETNIEKIHAEISDPFVFPRDPSLDERLARVQTRLRDVLDQQSAELDLLSATVDTNTATDLQSRRDPISETTLHDRITKRISNLDVLESTMAREAAAETRVAPAIDVLVEACR